MITYEIRTDEAGPYGDDVLGIWPSDAAPDDRLVFATFQRAKRELRAILKSREQELREKLMLNQYNQQDIRKLRKRQLENWQ